MSYASAGNSDRKTTSIAKKGLVGALRLASFE